MAPKDTDQNRTDPMGETQLIQKIVRTVFKQCQDGEGNSLCPQGDRLTRLEMKLDSVVTGMADFKQSREKTDLETRELLSRTEQVAREDRNKVASDLKEYHDKVQTAVEATNTNMQATFGKLFDGRNINARDIATGEKKFEAGIAAVDAKAVAAIAAVDKKVAIVHTAGWCIIATILALGGFVGWALHEQQALQELV